MLLLLILFLTWLIDMLTGSLPRTEGRGPRVVVSTAAFHARVRGSFWSLGGLEETKMFLPHPLVKLEYCGEPRWPRGSVLGLRPPGFKFWILCLEGIVISHISPSSWCSCPNLACMCTKVAYSLIHFISFSYLDSFVKGTPWDETFSMLSIFIIKFI